MIKLTRILPNGALRPAYAAPEHIVWVDDEIDANGRRTRIITIDGSHEVVESPEEVAKLVLCTTQVVLYRDAPERGACPMPDCIYDRKPHPFCESRDGSDLTQNAVSALMGGLEISEGATEALVLNRVAMDICETAGCVRGSVPHDDCRNAEGLGLARASSPGSR